MKTLKPTFFSLFLFISIIPCSFSQGWQRTFGTNESNKDNKILQLEDGNLIVAGTDIMVSGFSQIYLKKISPNGELLEQTNISENQSIHLNDFIRTSDGGFMGVGQYHNNQMGIYRAYIVRTNVEGDILWSIIDTLFDFSSANAVIELNDGKFLLAGSTASSAPEPVTSAAFMMKLGSEGEVLFTKVYEELNDDIFSEVLLETSQGEILMGGYISNPLASPGDTFLGKYDTNGNELWRTINQRPTVTKKLLELENNTFLIGGNSYGGETLAALTVIDEFGNEIWSKLYSAGHYFTEMGDVIQTEDKGFIISGRDGNLVTTTNPFPEEVYDAFLLKTDEFGNHLSTTFFGGEHEDGLSDIINTEDGGFAMSGYSYSFGEDVRQTYVLKTNSECKISSTKSIYPTIPSFQIFPNPVSDISKIDLRPLHLQGGQFQLFNSTGQKIRESDFDGSEFILKKNKLQIGLYLFQILEKGKIIGNGKIVVN